MSNASGSGTIKAKISYYLAPNTNNVAFLATVKNGTITSIIFDPAGRPLQTAPLVVGLGTIHSTIKAVGSGKSTPSGHISSSISYVVSQHVFVTDKIKTSVFGSGSKLALPVGHIASAVSMVRVQGQPVTGHVSSAVSLASTNPARPVGHVASSVSVVASGKAFGGGSVTGTAATAGSQRITVYGNISSRAPGSNMKINVTCGIQAGVTVYSYVGGGLYIAIGKKEVGGKSTSDNEPASGVYQFNE